MKRIIQSTFIILLLLMTGCSSLLTKYTYVGKITNMEGGSSGNILILTIDTIGKAPYTTQKYCSNKIRIGQSVYKSDNFLWVEYEPGRYC